MLIKLEIAREKAGFKMKVQQLEDHPKGIDFAGRLIKPFLNQYGKGFALTQPRTVIKITECLEGMGVQLIDEVQWLPVSEEWTPLLAAQVLKAGTERCDSTEYMILAGFLMWIHQTRPRSAMESILSSYSRNPGVTEMLCLIAVAKISCRHHIFH
jgi:hypothetical protein